MQKKSFISAHFLLSVILTAFFVFIVTSLEASSLELNTKSDVVSSLKTGNPANHKIQFKMATRMSSGTISISFGNLVADKKSVTASDVSLLYGVPGSEAEYYVQSTAGDGIWGAAFSSNASSTILTLSSPVLNSVPIDVGNNVIVNVGTDPRTDPGPISPADLAQQNNQQNNNNNGQIIAGNEAVKEPLVELVPDLAQNGDNQRNQAVGNLGKLQEFIQERLSKLRNLIEKKSIDVRPEAAPTIIANAPLPKTEIESEISGRSLKSDSNTIWSSNQGNTIRQEQEKKYIISLAPPRNLLIDANKENLIALEREDGGRLDMFVPASVTLDTNNITFDIKPLTFDQSKEWTKVKIVDDKRPMLAQVYVVTALDDQQRPVVQFDKPIKYNFHFTSKEIDEEGIDPHTLAVYSWDATEESLQREQSKVDLDSNIVSANIYHLTTFLLLGEPRKNSFTLLPEISQVSTIPSVQLTRMTSDISGDSFGLMNVKTAENITFAGNDFYISPNIRLSFCIPKKIFTKPVKSLSFSTESFPENFSFNKEKDCYTASFITSGVQSKKIVTIKIVYGDDQTQIMKYRANVIASELQVRVLSAIAPQVEKARVVVQAVNTQVEKAVVTSQPVLQTTAIAAGPIVSALNPTIISNSLNWYHYLNHFISLLLSALGLRKRRRPWGVVYNAISKMPVDLAIVRLFDLKMNKLIETQVTDKEGRFSFLTVVGEYTVSVTKPPFIFPSAIVQGDVDGDYAHVYHSTPFTIANAEEMIELSIPIDPPNPKHEKVKHTLWVTVKTLAGHYSGVSLVLSLVVSIVLAIYIPSPMNSFLLLLNSLFAISQAVLSTKKEKSWGMVFDVLTFEAIPLAAISIVNAKENKLLRTRLSDYAGRFSFLSPPGEYVLAISKDQYLFPPTQTPKIKKYKHLYLGGTIKVKHNKALVKTNIPMEKKVVTNPVVSATAPIEKT